MNTLRWALFAGLMLLAVVSIASYVVWRAGGAKPGATAEQRRAQFYCPMHPSYTSDKPGECPICGMTLDPIPASGTGADHAAMGHEGDVPGLSSVHLTPERIQLIGVRFARVEKRPLGGQLELVGFVAPDEARFKRVQIRAAGWVQELFVNRTGETVRAGQPLLAIYSPELYQSEQEFLIETAPAPRASTGDTVEAMARDDATALHGMGTQVAAGERLRLFGVPEDEIARLQRERTASTRLVLRAPVSGTVLERNLAEGQYVAADTPLFVVADLSRVWVLADLYEMDFGSVRVGDRARFTADALPNHPFEGRIEFVYPTVTSQTRTLKARVPLGNTEGLLRPGMYGRVHVSGRGLTALAVPGEAVIHTGEHDYLFVARSGGHFEPRMVWTGVRDGDRVQVLRGVAEGDTVVASASFLIDSESRLKAAIAGMGGPGQRPGPPPATGHPH
jgi:Cu(I)/Ag(I) efflux system membrane fusion protein